MIFMLHKNMIYMIYKILRDLYGLLNRRRGWLGSRVLLSAGWSAGSFPQSKDVLPAAGACGRPWWSPPPCRWAGHSPRALRWGEDIIAHKVGT